MIGKRKEAPENEKKCAFLGDNTHFRGIRLDPNQKLEAQKENGRNNYIGIATCSNCERNGQTIADLFSLINICTNKKKCDNLHEDAKNLKLPLITRNDNQYIIMANLDRKDKRHGIVVIYGNNYCLLECRKKSTPVQELKSHLARLNRTMRAQNPQIRLVTQQNELGPVVEFDESTYFISGLKISNICSLNRNFRFRIAPLENITYASKPKPNKMQ